MAAAAEQLSGQAIWLGGAANHNDIFKPVYHVLLALHTASYSQNVQAALSGTHEGLHQAAAGLADVTRQPVLEALLQCTTAAWAKDFTRTHVDQVCESSWLWLIRRLLVCCRNMTLGWQLFAKFSPIYLNLLEAGAGTN